MDDPPHRAYAHCAHAENRYLEFIDRLMSDKERSENKIVNFAIAAGVVNIARFRNCVTSNNYMRTVDEGNSLAEKLSLRGTPEVFVDGLNVGGAIPFVELAFYIERSLQRLPLISSKDENKPEY